MEGKNGENYHRKNSKYVNAMLEKFKSTENTTEKMFMNNSETKIMIKTPSKMSLSSPFTP